MGGWIGGQAEYVMVPYADFKPAEISGQGVDAIEKLQAAGLVGSLIVGSFETSVLT